ncbi:MAG: hypothetical protein HXS46_08600 [Theionarchaea archaeon]|nr:hypothetical protein [Theionarchaea archaeon]
MNVDKEIMNQVKLYAQEFVEREYPEEAPYFDIAWETYRKALQDESNTGPRRMLTVRDLKKPTVRDLKKPTVRLSRSSPIMAPRVIRAFHILFTVTDRVESESRKRSKQEMLQFFSQEKFSFEFSMKIVDFFTERRDSQ